MTLTVLVCLACRMTNVPDLAVSKGEPMPLCCYLEGWERKFTVSERYGLTEPKDIHPIKEWKTPKNGKVEVGGADVLDTMITSLVELLEDRGVFNQEEWEQKVKKNPKG